MGQDSNRKFHQRNANATMLLKCPACSHEFPMSAAVLTGLRTEIANELQADLKLREQHLEAMLRAASEKEAALAKKSADVDQRVDSLVEAQLKVKVDEVRRKEAKKAVDAQEEVVRDLQNELKEKAAALKRTQEQELALRREKRQLEEAKERLALEVQRTLAA